MPETSERLEALRAARVERDAERRDAQAARLSLLAAQRAAERAKRSGGDTGQADIARARAAVRARAETESAADARVKEAVGDLLRDLSPASLTRSWSADIPILLMPLRIETRYRDDELWVRVFPDEIAVDTHEEWLTAKEKEAGEDYWRARAETMDETGHKTAWRRLAAVAGDSRGSYVALRTRPENWGEPDLVADALDFPDQPILKQDAWTEPPRVRVLPDRLHLLLLRGGKVVRSVDGRPIADIVHAGPAPVADDGGASWDRDEDDGQIRFDDKSLWLKDFRRAEAEGLGFSLALGEDDDNGFEELIVLGLKHSADAEDGAALIAELFQAHRFSPKGLALVPQGTATNNSSDEDSGFESIDWFADGSFSAIKAGEADAAPTRELAQATDGERLEAYLGLPPGLLRGIANADRCDHAEAVAMNAALYPGTLGYVLRTMLQEVVPEARIEEIRQLFTGSVTGRGPLAALRVGNQPYGILLASAPPRDSADLGEPAGRGERMTIDRALEAVLARARRHWENFLPELARLGAAKDASADLLAVLGLHPNSVAHFQRVAVSFDHLSNLAAFQSGGHRFDDAQEQLFQGWVADLMLLGLGYRPNRPDGSAKPFPPLLELIHASRPTSIPSSHLIDGLPFSEQDPIKPYDEAASRNYIDWLIANARDAGALRRQDFGGAPIPTFLLYMMMRHALLIQTSVSVNRFLADIGIEAAELVVTRKFTGLTSARELSPWEILAAPARAVKGELASELPLIAHVHRAEFRQGPKASIGAPLGEMLAAYERLRGLPTARLERLLVEHLDTLSYRLDAWETALIDRRLVTRRNGGQAGASGRTGLYLGSVGYLEAVRRPRKLSRRPVKEERLPPALRMPGGSALYVQDKPAGYFHVPSINHATAGAVLRSGYLSHATPADPSPLAVNLGSRRTRRAKELLDGLRRGQSLEVLLGIEFERRLHDATTRAVGPVILNQFRPALRAAFPIKRMKTPRAGHPEEQPEIVADLSVVNGVDLARSGASFPTGIAGLESVDTDQINELVLAREAVRDSLDALKDVITAESAYQLALGNFDRSAAIVQSMAEPSPSPEIEVIRSSRGTSLSFTQRVALQFDVAAAGAWPGPTTPRARAEAPLNAWLVSLLPTPDQIGCKVVFTLDNASSEVAVPAAALRLQPIDLMFLARRGGSDGAPAELEARIRDAALQLSGADPRSTAAIAFTQPAAIGATTLAEALALLDLVHQLVAPARPLDGRDSLTVTIEGAPAESTGIDLAELDTRVGKIITDFAPLLAALNDAIATASAPGAGNAGLAALAAAQRAISDAGAALAYPGSASDTWVGHAESVAAALQEGLDRAGALHAEAGAAGIAIADAADKLVGAARALLGADFPLMPRFAYPNASAIAACEAGRAGLLAFAKAQAPEGDPVQEMLTGVAQVRPAIHVLHRLGLMHDLRLGTPIDAAALQLPPRENDVWLGAALPPGHEIFADTLSLVQIRPQGFNPTAKQCGLLIDQWTEALPRESEVTGLAFGFEQPNSEALQTLLLAVAGPEAKEWSWEALIESVRDTIHRAKLRAIEPDMLDRVDGLTAIIPATMAEFSTSKGGLSLDFGLASPLLLSQAIATGVFTVSGGD